MNRRGLQSRFSQQQTVVKHSLERRRTLKHKNTLMRQYGVWTVSALYVVFGLHMFNKWMNPPDYKTEEEEEMANLNFSLWDLGKRMLGFVHSFKESTDNKTEL